jgi:hypothetical protein
MSVVTAYRQLRQKSIGKLFYKRASPSCDSRLADQRNPNRELSSLSRRRSCRRLWESIPTMMVQKLWKTSFKAWSGPRALASSFPGGGGFSETGLPRLFLRESAPKDRGAGLNPHGRARNGRARIGSDPVSAGSPRQSKRAARNLPQEDCFLRLTASPGSQLPWPRGFLNAYRAILRFCVSSCRRFLSVHSSLA